MKRETEVMRLESPNRPQEPAVRDNLTRELLTEFVETTNSFQSAMKKFKSDIEILVKKEVLNKMPDVPDDDIENALQNSRRLFGIEDNCDSNPYSGSKSAELSIEYVAGSVMQSIVDSITVKYPALDHLNHALEDLHNSFYFNFLVAQNKKERSSSMTETSQEYSLRDLIDQEAPSDLKKHRLYRNLYITGAIAAIIAVIILIVYICVYRNF